jgi:FHA domain
MRFLFEAEQTTSDLDLGAGLWTVGGAQEDGVRVAGLSPGMVSLEVTETAVWLRCQRELRVGRGPVAPGMRRLLLPGEAVELGPAMRLRRAAEGTPTATRALLQSWVRDEGPGARSAAAELVCVAGPDAPSAFPLTGAQIELGRLPGCGVQLRDRSISRRHARLVRAGPGHRLEDLGGPNPTRRNGRRLRTPAVLEDGDVIELGKTLLRYLAAEPDPRPSEGSPRPLKTDPGLLPSVLNARRPIAQAPLRPFALFWVVALGVLCGGSLGRLLLSASATARPAPPAAPSTAGAERRSW